MSGARENYGSVLEMVSVSLFIAGSVDSFSNPAPIARLPSAGLDAPAGMPHAGPVDCTLMKSARILPSRSTTPALRSFAAVTSIETSGGSTGAGTPPPGGAVPPEGAGVGVGEPDGGGAAGGGEAGGVGLGLG